MQQDTPRQGEPKENEVDLGVFFTIMSRIFNKIGTFLLYIINSLNRAVIYILLLIKRNLIWLALGGALGFALGVWQYSRTGPTYYSTMIVKANFESSRLLYQKIEYLNALIRERQTSQLQKIFNIDTIEARQLITFRITPVNDQLENAKLYKNNFLEYKRNSAFTFDTSWARTIKYSDFIQNLTDYDYPLQSIELYSRSALIYPKIQDGFVKLISENAALARTRDSIAVMQKLEEGILLSSLNGLDSLRQAYYKQIINEGKNGTPRENASNLVFMQGTPRSPELELFDKELLLKDELIAAKKRSMELSDIIQVYAEFNGVGKRTSALNAAFISLTWQGVIVTFLIILIVLLYKNLHAIDKRRRQSRKANN